MSDVATYQREKDGAPDVAMCEECGTFEPDGGVHFGLCQTCAWDLYGDDGAEE